jgi:hypothetical protein
VLPNVEMWISEMAFGFLFRLLHHHHHCHLPPSLPPYLPTYLPTFGSVISYWNALLTISYAINEFYIWDLRACYFFLTHMYSFEFLLLVNIFALSSTRFASAYSCLACNFAVKICHASFFLIFKWIYDHLFALSMNTITVVCFADIVSLFIKKRKKEKMFLNIMIHNSPVCSRFFLKKYC